MRAVTRCSRFSRSAFVARSSRCAPLIFITDTMASASGSPAPESLSDLIAAYVSKAMAATDENSSGLERYAQTRRSGSLYGILADRAPPRPASIRAWRGVSSCGQTGTLSLHQNRPRGRAGGISTAAALLGLEACRRVGIVRSPVNTSRAGFQFSVDTSDSRNSSVARASAPAPAPRSGRRARPPARTPAAPARSTRGGRRPR